MGKLATTVQALLGIVLLGVSAAKLAGAADVERDRLAIAAWFWVITGVVELIGALGLLAGLKFRRLSAPAGVWVTVEMVAALAAHLRAGDPPAAMLPAALILVLALTVARVRAGQVSMMARAERVPSGAAD